MKYRRYGRADLEVSEIGVGGHREGVETGAGIGRTARFFVSARERARVIGAAIDAGVNYFDTTYGCEIASLGESLRILGRRDGLFVSGMRVDFFKNLLADEADPRRYTRREVEARLEKFGFDHIDQFMMGAMDFSDPLSHPRSMLEDAFDELQRLRDEGKVSYLGISCHEPDYAARLLDALPELDAVMVPYNFVNRAAEGVLSERIKETGAALVAMKTLVWRIYGIPVTALRHLRPIPGRLEFGPSAPIGRLAHRFVLENPLVATCVPAVNSVEELKENTSASDRGPLTEGEKATLKEYAAATLAEDMTPFAIGGLLDDNLRVRAHAIGHLKQKLGFDAADPDWSSEDAPQRAAEAAEALKTRLLGDPRWTPLL